MEEFKILGLSDSAVQALAKKGFTKPTSIQAKVIPLLLAGTKDVVGQSQTGTGKTASFGLPILEKIDKQSRHVQAIVLVPTRELAIQVALEIASLRGDTSIEILSVYGGSGIDQQIKKLRQGVGIVVGTPGRVMDLQRRGALKIDHIQYAVLDEADEMLNMGFVEDIKTILENTPQDKKMLLFSATMPKQILNIAKTYMREYDFIEVEKTEVITKTVEQVYYNISAKDRVEGIRRIIDYYVDFHGIIFCNTKASVDTVTNQLLKMEYNAAALHGDITQGQREKILLQFRNKRITVLVATDVAARGIDVNDLTHVINFSLPQSPESYVHRIGRTGRAGKKGMAITFIMPSERQRLRFVEKVNSCKLEHKEIPSPEEIVQHKEHEVKGILQKIIEVTADSKSKYDAMADELIKDQDPKKVLSALLKYTFKNELELTNYRQLSTPRDGEALPPDADNRRGGGRGGRGGDRGGSRGFSRDGRRSSGSRDGGFRSGSRDGSRDRPRSDRPRSDRSRSDRSRSDRSRSDRPSFNRSRDGDRSERRSFDRPRSDRSGSDRPRSDRPRDGERRSFDRPRSDRSSSDRPRSDRPRSDGPRDGSRNRSPSAGMRDGFRSDRPRSDRPSSDRPRSDRSSSDRPRSDRPVKQRFDRASDRPGSDRSGSDRPRSDRPRSERSDSRSRDKKPRPRDS